MAGLMCKHCGKLTPSITRTVCDDCLSPSVKASIKVTKGIPVNRQVSDVTRQKLSDAAKMRKFSPESREKLSKSLTGKVMPEEVKRKISEAKLGKKMPPEVGQKISDVLTGRKLTPEHSAKISKALIGRKLSAEHAEKVRSARKGKPSAFKGRKHTSDAKDKMSKFRKGKPPSNKGMSPSVATRRKISKTLTGRTLPLEHKQKMAKAVADGRIGGYNWAKRSTYLAKSGQVVHCRSSWEHKVAEYLDKHNINWAYEPEVLTFESEVYIPDFYIYDHNNELLKIIEVKGWLRDDAATKLAIFSRYFAASGVLFELWDKAKLKELGIL